MNYHRHITRTWVALVCTTAVAACSLLFDSPNQAIDAGPELDANLEPLTTSFGLLPPPCGETQISPNSVRVVVPEGAPLVGLYRWVLSGPTGEQLFADQAPPDAPIPRGAHAIGGTFAEPEFNLTLYRGKNLGHFRRENNDFIPGLYQVMGLLPGEYDLEGIISMPGGQSLDALLRNAQASGTQYSAIHSADCNNGGACDGLQYLRVRIPTNSKLQEGDANGALMFVLQAIGDLYIDGVSLHYQPTGEDLITNGSFDALEGWTVRNEASGGLEIIPIPDEFTAYGNYTVSLTAIDALGNEGPVVSKTVEHAACE